MHKIGLVMMMSGLLAMTGCAVNELEEFSAQHAKPKSAPIPAKFRFDPLNDYVIQNVQIGEQAIRVRVFENVPYAKADGQTLTLYIPETYFLNGVMNGYTAQTAPILVSDSNNLPTLGAMLAYGFVVATVRTGLDDSLLARTIALKSAIRYLTANDRAIAGRADRIVLVGAGAAGLVGTTGNHVDYQDELHNNGALVGSDAVFAVASDVPLSNSLLNNMAYEWQFDGVYHYQQNTDIHHFQTSGLDDAKKELSKEFNEQFINYINHLNLKGHNNQKLILNEIGQGSFKDEMLFYLNNAINSVHHQDKQGVHLPTYSFLTQNKSPDPYYISDYKVFLNNYIGRSHGVPAFGEVTWSEQLAKLTDPMVYIGHEGASVASHWRIRAGVRDNRVSLPTSLILATRLKNYGKRVDFAYVWDGQGREDWGEVLAWADRTVKENP